MRRWKFVCYVVVSDNGNVVWNNPIPCLSAILVTTNLRLSFQENGSDRVGFTFLRL